MYVLDCVKVGKTSVEDDVNCSVSELVRPSMTEVESSDVRTILELVVSMEVEEVDISKVDLDVPAIVLTVDRDVSVAMAELEVDEGVSVVMAGLEIDVTDTRVKLGVDQAELGVIVTTVLLLSSAQIEQGFVYVVVSNTVSVVP